MIYRSGLKFRPALALGGHAFVLTAPQGRALVAGVTVLLEERAVTVDVWRCLNCYAHIPGWALTEGFFPRPCMGRVRAIAAPCHIPETEDSLNRVYSDIGSRRAASPDLIPDSEPS